MSRLQELLAELSTSKYVTADSLSARFHVSSKTIRTWIKKLADEAAPFGIHIKSKARYGYLLVCDNQARITEFLESTQPDEIPDTASGRIDYLLMYLLNHDEYITLEKLSDFLYVSRPTIQGTIKELEAVLNQYRLKLERRPKYGIRVSGREFDFRRCLGDYFIRRNRLEFPDDTHRQEKMSVLITTIKTLLDKYDIHLAETALETFVIQIHVAVSRMHQGRFVRLHRSDVNHLSEKEWHYAIDLMRLLAAQEQLEYREEEAVYIVIYLKGKRMMGNMESDEANFVIREDIDGLTMQMLNLVYHDFRFDLRNNFEIRMIMNQHMVPLDIRMRFDIQSKNPLLDSIKSRYILAFTMAVHACAILAEHYQKEVTEDEIGYLALIFALATEQNRKYNKVNILIVCSSGKGSSRLLLYKYRQEFADYIDRIYICDLTEVAKFDFSKVAYVLTTVPIGIHIPRPILEVGLFLGESDKNAVKSLLAKGEKQYLYQYYSKDAFFTDIKGNNKDTILKELCHRISLTRTLPEGFYEAVLRREQLAQTDFGNYIAMPHPYQTMTEETFVYVAVLDKPVFWSRYEVQIIFLIAVGSQEDEYLNQFYEDTTQLILKPDSVKQLLQNPSFETLIDLL